MKKLNIIILMLICFFVGEICVFAKCDSFSKPSSVGNFATDTDKQNCRAAVEDGYKCDFEELGVSSPNQSPGIRCYRTEEKYVPTEESNDNEEIVTDTANLKCSAWGDVLVDLQNLFNFLKVIIPLLIMGLSIYDFIKALAGKDNKDVKKAFQRLLKRFVYALIFFFLPILINFILYLAGTGANVCIEG